ncbi:Calx-beta domain-containing protein, partial [Nostoc sp.]|uniref:Calx-beta domain-containing protein n=1 Tax=Nostoc sp. TaxID=1180 RepID=UPI0035934F83
DKALGDIGSSLGYGNQEFKGTNQIGKSLAIEFDTYKNAWDQNNNHVAVLLNGDVTSQKAVAVPTFQLNSGNFLDAWLDYNGLTNNLRVYVGTNVKPSTALLTYNVDLTSVVGNQAYVGFSAGTGSLINNHDIDSWNFSTSSSASSNIASTLAFSEQNYSVNERDKTITVTVNRTGSNNKEVSVNYATSDRTAKAGIDYIATTGILNFVKGQTSANITISVLDDSQLDPNLAFLLTLSNPINAGLGTQKTSVITLLDNDASAAANVTTQHNDNNRTGAELNEVLLNTTNVNDDKFGKLFTRPVDGQIYTQPLYLANVNIPNQGVHNVVYVATMHNTVYAFDADDPNASTPLWSISLGPSVKLPDPNIGPYPNYRDIATEVGILSTPVISTTTNTLYVVAFTKESGNYIYRLHALDLKTGAEKFGGPVVISGTVPGTGSASVNGVITFTPNLQNQRPGLLLSNGNIYIAFASFGDKGSYSGWVFDYNATTLKRSAIYNNTPDGKLGGIWQAGNGLAADDSGNVYLSSGNGTFKSDGSNLGTSVVKLSSNLTPIDWFTPYNYQILNALDDDLGSGGPLLIPNSKYIIAGGKEGKIYVLDRTNLGKFNAKGDTQIVQSFQAIGTPVNKVNAPSGTHHIHGSPIYWNSPNGPLIYVWGENDWARAYSFNGTTLNTTPLATSSMTVPDGMPGAMLSLSANGSTDGTGILWTSSPFDKDANNQTVSGILRAFDATTMTELWNSKEDASRDDVGKFGKFTPPTIANGKVYLSTFSSELAVYGLDT